MIRIFSQIRKTLIAQRKLRSYLPYAFGEIILVVIGILIALQINNWNEERKASASETLFLKEFKNSIDKDLSNFVEHFDTRLKRKKSGLDSLFYYMHNRIELHDSQFIPWYLNMRQSIRLGHDNGPYEALKSSGLTFIKNDSLRSAINRTYSALPFFQFFSHETDAENNPRIYDLEYKIFNLKTSKQGRERGYMDLDVKVNQVLTNQDFLWIYNLELEKYNSYTHRLQQMRATLNNLKVQLELELKK